jgi:AraC-like DNA-binding protein
MSLSVSSEWMRVLLGVAEQHGLDSAAWLRGRGYPPDCLSAERVPFELEDAIFLDMGERFPSFGLTMIPALRPGPLARVSYAMQASRTLRVALDKIILVSRMFNEGYRTVKSEAEEGLEITTVRIAPGDLIVPCRAQFLLGRMTFFARNILRSIGQREVSPAVVRFRSRPVPNAEELRRFFGDCIQFSQPRDSVTFRRQDVDQPNPLADPNLEKILDEAISRQLAELPSEGVVERIHNEVAVAMAFGVPQAGEIAARVGMSTRTMNRQLAESNTSFSDLLQSIRFARAQSWLDAGESATAVTALVFYSEVAAFFRGYRRHFGRNPSASAAEASALEAAAAEPEAEPGELEAAEAEPGAEAGGGAERQAGEGDGDNVRSDAAPPGRDPSDDAP